MKLTKEKRKQLADEAKKRRESQTIIIDEHWRIVRIDEMNWQIQCDGKEMGYYGKRLTAAFRALPAQMLSESNATSLKAIIEAQRVINARIETVLLNL